MAADSKLILPGNFQKGKTYTIDGETMMAWRDALLADRIVPGTGLKETQTPGGGRILTAVAGAGGGGSLLSGSFYRALEDGDDTYLQGGSVTGGDGTESMDDYLVMDVAGPTETAGTRLWIKITVDAFADDADEMLIGGCEVTNAEYGTGSTIPDADFPTLGSSGHFYTELGRWTATLFAPATAGNFLVGLCAAGNWEISRI